MGEATLDLLLKWLVTWLFLDPVLLSHSKHVVNERQTKHRKPYIYTCLRSLTQEALTLKEQQESLKTEMVALFLL